MANTVSTHFVTIDTGKEGYMTYPAWMGYQDALAQKGFREMYDNPRPFLQSIYEDVTFEMVQYFQRNYENGRIWAVAMLATDSVSVWPSPMKAMTKEFLRLRKSACGVGGINAVLQFNV